MNKKKKLTVRKVTPYLLLLPGIIFLCAFMIYPLITVFRYSLMNYDVSRIAKKGYIGFENFVTLFTNSRQSGYLVSSLLISVRWVAVQVISQLILGVLLALLLDTKFVGRGFYRCIVFIPWAISGVLTSMLWRLIYDENTGLLNSILLQTGILEQSISWTSNTSSAFISTCVAEIWRGIPFMAITALAALQSISGDLHEACVVDGGNLLQEVFLIKLPLIRDAMLLSTLLRCVWEFNNVDLIFTLTNGGPKRSTMTLTMFMVDQGISNGNYGYASTISVVIFFILLIFAAVYMWVTKFGKED